MGDGGFPERLPACPAGENKLFLTTTDDCASLRNEERKRIIYFL